MSEDDRIVFGGVDTHRDVHVAAVVDATGRVLDTATNNAAKPSPDSSAPTITADPTAHSEANHPSPDL